MSAMPDSDSGMQWSVYEVFLLTDGRDGRVAIPHLQLNFVATGIELVKANAESAWYCAWDDVIELSTAERSVLPDGREGVVVVVEERGGRSHRFVAPSDDPTVVEARVRDLVTIHGLRAVEPSRAVSRTLTVAVILATLATLTALLLSAEHVIHF
jgi:hypothetical protein